MPLVFRLEHVAGRFGVASNKVIARVTWGVHGDQGQFVCSLSLSLSLPLKAISFHPNRQMYIA